MLCPRAFPLKIGHINHIYASYFDLVFTFTLTPNLRYFFPSDYLTSCFRQKIHTVLTFLHFFLVLETVTSDKKIEVDKEKISDKSDDTTEMVSGPPTKQPEQPLVAKKTEDKKSTVNNPLSVVGVSMGTKQDLDSKSEKAKSKNICEVSQQKDTDVSTK